MPDSDNSRLARVEQRLEDLSRTLDAFGPTVATAAVQTVQMQHLDDDLKRVHEEMRGLRNAIDTRDAQTSKERRDTRVALWSLVGVLVSALISGLAAVLVAVIGG